MADAVDDAKVQAAYDKQVAEFQPQPEFSAAHILVDSEEKATALKAEIDGGADFAEVAKANSSDGSAASAATSAGSGPGRWCRSSRPRSAAWRSARWPGRCSRSSAGT